MHCFKSRNKKVFESFSAKNIFYFGNLKFCENLDKNVLLNNNSKFLKSSKFWLCKHMEKMNFVLIRI